MLLWARQGQERAKAASERVAGSNREGTGSSARVELETSLLGDAKPDEACSPDPHSNSITSMCRRHIVTILNVYGSSIGKLGGERCCTNTRRAPRTLSYRCGCDSKLDLCNTRLFGFLICHLQSHKLQFVDHFLGQISSCSDSLTLHRLFILLPCLRRSSSAPMERTDNWRVVVTAGICQARPRKLSKLACISLQSFRSRCTFSTATSRHSLLCSTPPPQSFASGCIQHDPERTARRDFWRSRHLHSTSGLLTIAHHSAGPLAIH